ncbi:MAG TPA: hypothetical protein VGO11_10075 [Chthoniobacteraceae bacterium]|jgi:hypothetical protein|nr:hypothetical protein [Chthoniobacteraceae bacterium]
MNETPSNPLKGMMLGAGAGIFAGQILGGIIFAVFKFCAAFISLPLEIFLRKNTGLRYYHPLLLLFQAVLGIPIALTSFGLSFAYYKSEPRLMATALATAVWNVAVSMESIRRLRASYRQVRGRGGKIIFTKHEGALRFCFIPLRGYFRRNMVNEAIASLAIIAVYAMIGGIYGLAAGFGAVFLAFVAIQVRRLLRQQEIWTQAFDAVDAQYFAEFQKYLVTTFLPERLEQPLSNPLADYLRGLPAPVGALANAAAANPSPGVPDGWGDAFAPAENAAPATGPAEQEAAGVEPPAMSARTMAGIACLAAAALIVLFIIVTLATR